MKLSALVRAKGVSDWAALHLRFLDESGRWVLRKNKSFEGTFNWKTLSVEVEVPEDAACLQYGIVFESPGRSWVGRIKLEEFAPRM